MATSIENLKVGAKYRVKKGSKTVATGTFTRRLARHPYGHKGRPVEIEEADGQAGFYSEEEGYTFEEAAPPPAPPVEVSIDAKKSELEEDIFTGDELKQGDRVIRIGEKNNWIYNREELEKWWKKNPNTNPLVSGTQKMAEGTKIEYGTLNILPSGGRRRTKKSKRRARKTRRRHK